MEFMERVRENPEYDSQIKACAREAFAWAMLKDKTVLIIKKISASLPLEEMKKRQGNDWDGT